MCIGLGLIFGIMRIVNFAQGELLMLGMFASFYLVTEGRVLSFLGPYWGPFIGAMCAGPAGLRRRRAPAQVPHLPRVRPAHGGLARRGPLRPARRHPGHLADPPERRADPVRLHARGRAHAALLRGVPDRPGLRRRHRVPEQGQAGRLLRRDPGRDRALPDARVHAPGQGPAGRGRQPDGGHLHGDRRRPRLPHRLRPGERHHRGRRRADGHLHLLRSLRRLRLRHHHVLGRRAGRHGQHPRRVLGRADGGLRPAVLGADPAARSCRTRRSSSCS